MAGKVAGSLQERSKNHSLPFPILIQLPPHPNIATPHPNVATPDPDIATPDPNIATPPRSCVSPARGGAPCATARYTYFETVLSRVSG